METSKAGEWRLKVGYWVLRWMVFGWGKWGKPHMASHPRACRLQPKSNWIDEDLAYTQRISIQSLHLSCQLGRPSRPDWYECPKCYHPRHHDDHIKLRSDRRPATLRLTLPLLPMIKPTKAPQTIRQATATARWAEIRLKNVIEPFIVNHLNS